MGLTDKLGENLYKLNFPFLINERLLCFIKRRETKRPY